MFCTLLLAEEVILVFPAPTHFLFEGLLKILDVNFENDSTSTEGVGHFNFLKVVNAEKVWDWVDDPIFNILNDFFHLIFFGIDIGFNNDFNFLGIFVLID